MKKPEILAPAGDYSRLVYAIEYGADAVYIGGEEYSLRTAVANFKPSDMEKAVMYAHSKGVKIYVACNSVPFNDEIEKFPEYIKFLEKINVDAVICSDLGMFTVVRQTCPNMEIHVSTQANITNYQTATTWYKLGAKRVVLARELTLEQIRTIREKSPQDLEIEVFVHGAMCMSHSGRCLISNFLTSRDANRGNCSQPCRWRYFLMEEQREGEYFPIMETDTGTFIFNSKDMCMITHIPELLSAGIDSFKIEGRVKTEYYVSCITQAYRTALDACFEDLSKYSLELENYYSEVCKVSHRDYFTGFYFGDEGGKSMNFKESSYIRDFEVIAAVLSYDSYMHCIVVKQKNKFVVGDVCEILEAGKEPYLFTIDKMFDANDNEILVAPHAEMTVKIMLDHYVGTLSFIRRKKG